MRNDWKTSIPQDDNIFLKYKKQAYPANRTPHDTIYLSKTVQILAKTRFNIEPGISMDYYNANYSSPAVLPDEVYDSSKKYNRNRLGLYKDHIIVPRSETGNILRIYDLNFDTPKSALQLATPITQIVSNGRKILVKTMGHVYCLDDSLLEGDIRSEESELYSHLNYGIEPLHIAASRKLNEAVVLLPDGTVNIWNLQLNQTFKWSDLLLFGERLEQKVEGSSNTPYDPTEYFTCEYATHPRQLLFSNGDKAVLGDLRMEPKTVTVLYPPTKDEKITDIKPNCFTPFQFAVAVGSKLILRDSRFLKKSLLQWNFGHSKESRTFLEFGSATDIYTWGQIQAEIVLYQTSNEPCPKSVNFQACKSFYSHSSFSGDPYPVPFAFISENTFQQELLHRAKVKPWPNMIGFAVNNSENNTQLYHLDDELALYANGWSKSPIEDNQRWLELDSKSRVDTETFAANYKFPPRFEANHEYVQVKSVLDSVKARISEAVESEPPEVDVECTFEKIESLYDIVSRKTNKIDYSESHSGEFPHLAGISAENSKAFLDQTILDLPTDSIMLNANIEQIKADIASLPQASSLEFPEGTTKLAKEMLENDLLLSRTVVIPRSDTRALVEFDDGSHSGHHSSIASPLWEGNINFKGIPSWLFELWGKENPLGDMQLESDDGWSSGKSEYSSGISAASSRSHQSDASSGISGRRVKIKRHAEDSSSGFVPLTLPIPDVVQTAPQIVRSASQPNLKNTGAKKKKRKIGF